MARKYEEIIAELRERGLDETSIDELTEAWSASPIRKERDAIAAERDALRDAVLSTKFEKFGVKIKPQALQRPSDLDITDDDKLKNWLTDAGVLTPEPEPTPDPAVTADLQAQQRMAAATAGAGEVDPNATFHEDLNNANTPDEVMAVLTRHGRTEVAL